VDPQGYDNIVGPVTNQIASDVTTSSLAALVVVFTFSFKQAATVSSNASLPERKRQQHVSVFLVFLIGPVGTPLMLLQNILLWRSMKLLWLTIVLLVSIATFSVDFLRVRSVLLQHLEGIGHSSLQPEVKNQLRRLNLFALSVYSIGGSFVVVIIYLTVYYLNQVSLFDQARNGKGFAWRVTGSPDSYPLGSVLFRTVQYVAVACTLLCFYNIDDTAGSRPASAFEQSLISEHDDDRPASVSSQKYVRAASQALPTREGDGESGSMYSVNEGSFAAPGSFATPRIESGSFTAPGSFAMYSESGNSNDSMHRSDEVANTMA
jgi:hypothetical protein